MSTHALAWRFNEHLSVGGSLDIDYAEAELTLAVDFGTLCVAQQMQGRASYPTALANCATVGLVPLASGGLHTLKGDGWSYGLSLGGALQFNEGRTHAGLVWHGPVNQRIKGRPDFANVPGVFAAAFSDSGAEVELTLPEVISVSLAHAAG